MLALAIFKVRALPEICNPLPVKSLNDSPLTRRLVVLAVMNDEYMVDDEYGEITEVPKYPVLGLVAQLAPISYELSVKRRLPVKVPPVKERSSEACPVRAPLKVVAVIVPAEKLPEESRKTRVLAVLVEEVATLAKVLAPEKYGMLPMTAALDVDSPLKPTTEAERVIGQVTPILACLVLRVVCKSVPLRERVPKYPLVDDA